MRPSNANKVLSQRLTTLLDSQDLSRMEIARRMGVGDGTLGGIKYGTGNPTVDVVERIARYFRVPTWELLRPLDEPRHIGDAEASYQAPGLEQAVSSLTMQQQQALLKMIRAFKEM